MFQSVVGNPLLSVLSDDLINQELSDFVYHHFREIITKDHQAALLEAHESITEGDPVPEDVFSIIKNLNIPDKK